MSVFRKPLATAMLLAIVATALGGCVERGRWVDDKGRVHHGCHRGATC